MQDPQQDTEWNDALRKHGIIGEREATAEELTSAAAETTLSEAAARVQIREGPAATADNTLDELDLLLDDVAEDDEEEARQRYREKRIAELKAEAALPQFGEVINITATEYVREVNEAGEGVWAVLLLYNTALPACRRLQQIIAVLACKHPGTKFVQSVGANCIPNYPDRNLPTVFIYHEGELMTQYVGPKIFGGESMGVKDVEWALAQQKALTTDLEADPKAKGVNHVNPIGITLSESSRRVLSKDRAKGRKNSDDEDSDDD